MTLPSSDAPNYSSDSTVSRNPAPPNSDLSGQIPLDGTRAAAPNTADRHLTPVGITDSSKGTDGKPDCDFITTKFNAHKDASYEVTIRDGKIYIKTENGEQQTQPQQNHPANVAEQARRDANYYGPQTQPQPQYEQYPSPQYAQYPPNEGYYGSPMMAARGPWGYDHHRGNIVENVLGGVLGGLTGGMIGFGGHRHGYYPQGAGYYQPAPIAYMPQHFPVIGANYNYQQPNYNYQQPNYNYQQPNYAASDSTYYNGSNVASNYNYNYRPANNPSSYDASTNPQTAQDEYNPNYYS
jgi:hypothetical protein